MNTRKTHDYTPTRPGSREENQAINARREMMNGFANRVVKPEPRRKTERSSSPNGYWEERMERKAKGFTIGGGDGYKHRSAGDN